MHFSTFKALLSLLIFTFLFLVSYLSGLSLNPHNSGIHCCSWTRLANLYFYIHYWYSLYLRGTGNYHFVLILQYNYGGIQLKSDKTNNDSEVAIVPQWNIADNLPKETQVIDIYIIIMLTSYIRMIDS